MWHGERGAGSCGSVSSVGCGSVSGSCGVSVGAHGVHHVRVHGVVGVHGGIAEGVGVLLLGRLLHVEGGGVGVELAVSVLLVAVPPHGLTACLLGDRGELHVVVEGDLPDGSLLLLLLLEVDAVLLLDLGRLLAEAGVAEPPGRSLGTGALPIVFLLVTNPSIYLSLRRQRAPSISSSTERHDSAVTLFSTRKFSVFSDRWRSSNETREINILVLTEE